MRFDRVDEFQYALTLDAPDVQYIPAGLFPAHVVEDTSAQGHTFMVRDGFAAGVRLGC